MSKGFLTLAQNGNNDYVRMAYALGMSLKLSQSTYSNLSVIVNKGEKIPRKYKKIFDKIIFIDDVETKWKVINKWKYFDLSPYDETIVLDSDMLFFTDILTWWKCLEKSSLEFTTVTKNYRGENTSSDFYRKVFTINKLPNLHTALFYFKKDKEAEIYFKFLKILFENWKIFYKQHLKEKPTFLSGDVAYALAAKIMFNRKWESFLTFIHMRSRLQDDDIVNDWNKELESFFTNYHGTINLKISNINQLYPFHYIKKDFLTQEVIDIYEDTLSLL